MATIHSAKISDLEIVRSDGASFGGVQAMDPFLKQFGTWDAETEEYYLPSSLQSLMNSIPLIGKFLGTVIVGPIIEKFGHRWTMAFTCSVQVVGPISKQRGCLDARQRRLT